MKNKIYSIAAAIAFTIPAIASADTEVSENAENQLTVKYSPLIASTASGRAEIEAQIKRAASQLCGPRSFREAGSLTEMKRNKSCYNAAVKDGMSQIKTSDLVADNNG
ncbi:MAG: UrcA family protein [Pseudohongiellaceae bacterium]